MPKLPSTYRPIEKKRAIFPPQEKIQFKVLSRLRGNLNQEKNEKHLSAGSKEVSWKTPSRSKRGKKEIVYHLKKTKNQSTQRMRKKISK